MMTTEQVKKLIEDGIPGAAVEVRDITGTSDHFAVRVSASAFAGKSLMQQHRMVHAALGQHLTTSIHAVDIKTSVPPS
jgi:stress-induced morphogen